MNAADRESENNRSDLIRISSGTRSEISSPSTGMDRSESLGHQKRTVVAAPKMVGKAKRQRRELTEKERAARIVEAIGNEAMRGKIWAMRAIWELDGGLTAHRKSPVIDHEALFEKGFTVEQTIEHIRRAYNHRRRTW